MRAAKSSSATLRRAWQGKAQVWSQTISLALIDKTTRQARETRSGEVAQPDQIWQGRFSCIGLSGRGRELSIVDGIHPKLLRTFLR